MQHNALAGPFKTMPFKPFHYSPLLSCPKEGDSRKIIVNLSYPEGHSVNSNILKDEYDGYKFQLSYPSVDNIVDHIANSNDNLLLYKLDISSAFRNLRNDPLHYGDMGIYWGDNCFIDAIWDEHVYAATYPQCYLVDKSMGHGGRVVTLSPPTSEAGVRSPSRPYVGKLVVACR